MRAAFIYSTDEGGFDLVRHSAMSLALSQKSPCSIHVFCYRFLPGSSDRLPAALRELGATLTLDRIEDAELERHETCLHVTKPALLRLLAMERLTALYDRIVYLDNDVLVFDDLGIEELDFGSSSVAAVVDMDLSETGAIARSQRREGGADYFNSGFIACDARRWRGGEVRDRYLRALAEHAAGCSFKAACTSIDQCAANHAFAGDWAHLPLSYNMQASAKYTAHWRNAKVRHYCGARKFLPLAPFRNDGRDTRLLNQIRARLGMSRVGTPAAQELLYRLNALRQRRLNADMRRFCSALASEASWAGAGTAGHVHG